MTLVEHLKMHGTLLLLLGALWTSLRLGFARAQIALATGYTLLSDSGFVAAGLLSACVGGLLLLVWAAADRT